VDANREWAQHAGALVLVVASKSFRHNGKPNRWSWFDCGQATAHLMLEAVHQGLRAHAMAGFDADAAHERCQLDIDQEAACFVAIGRHGELEEHSDALRERDAAENQRIELARVVSQGGIGEPSQVVGAPAAKD
jgi:nitroreductase